MLAGRWTDAVTFARFGHIYMNAPSDECAFVRAAAASRGQKDKASDGNSAAASRHKHARTKAHVYTSAAEVQRI